MKNEVKNFLLKIATQRRRLENYGLSKKKVTDTQIRQVEAGASWQDPVKFLRDHHSTVEAVCPSANYDELNKLMEAVR
jgi:hypothetical protein